jgi:uncharacterized protein (DUF2267 family)
MSATGLEVFDKTLQTTNVWLKEIGEEIGPDRHRCYQALRAVLFALRDRLTVDDAAHLSAQLPILVRGIFYEGYRPAKKPERIRTQEEFLKKVGVALEQVRPLGADDAVRAVFKVLGSHITAGELEKIKQSLPHEIRAWFPEPGGQGEALERSQAGG